MDNFPLNVKSAMNMDIFLEISQKLPISTKQWEYTRRKMETCEKERKLREKYWAKRRIYKLY
jgi:hypothetical protein